MKCLVTVGEFTDDYLNSVLKGYDCQIDCLDLDEVLESFEELVQEGKDLDNLHLCFGSNVISKYKFEGEFSNEHNMSQNYITSTDVVIAVKGKLQELGFDHTKLVIVI